MKTILAASLLAAVSLGTLAEESYMYFVNPNNNVVTKLFTSKCDMPNAPEGWKNLIGIWPKDFPGPNAGQTIKGCWVVHDDHIDLIAEDGSQAENISPKIFKPGPVSALKPIQQGKGI